MIPQLPQLTSPKGGLDILLLAHAGIACSVGLLALLVPHAFGWFLGEEFHGTWRWNPDEGQVKVTHVVIRLYGALIFAQTFIVWQVRQCQDLAMRQGIVRAYFVMFFVSTIVLMRAHFTEEHWHPLNWLNLVCFFALAVAYAYFNWAMPMKFFEGDEKMRA
mmetsp:Transcript_58760/g.140033  ORF Transcript_58760/g.140033 Transcript_58760/m.140033 type:complete len:161 (+) Transcript_58760:117-599(+)